MKFALFQAGVTADGQFVVSEIVEAPRVIDGHTFKLTELYHASIVATARRCDDTVSVGDLYDVTTEEFTAAPVVEALVVESDSGNGEPPPR